MPTGGDNRRSINDVIRENQRERNNMPKNVVPRRQLTSNNSSGTTNSRQQRLNNAQERMQRMLAELEEQEKAQIVKLGDASIAAPFTSKLSSIQCSMC